MRRNSDPEGECLFSAWESQFETWEFCPAQFDLSEPAIHYIHALVSLIWDNTRVRKDDVEDSVEANIVEDIRATSVLSYKFDSLDAYKFTCDHMGSLRKGKQFVVARTDRETDADYSCTFRVLSVQVNTVIACSSSSRVPNDIFEGSWFMCVMDTEAQHAMRQTLNTRYFAEKSVNPRVFKLIAESDVTPLEQQEVWNKRPHGTRASLSTKLNRWEVKFKLNPSQTCALLHSFTDVLSLVQGPPGTGKTTLCNAIIHAHDEVDSEYLFESAKIACCAISNHAVDHMFVKVEKTLPEKVLRSGDPSNFTAGIFQQYSHCVLDTLAKKKTCKRYLHANTKGAKKARREEFEPEVLSDRRIVFCTLSSLLGLQSMRRQQYAHTVIDEAAQSSEADFVGAASQSWSITLVGDPCQLAPAYVHPLMRISIMDRLLKNSAFTVTVLDIQYSWFTESCAEDELSAVVGHI